MAYTFWHSGILIGESDLEDASDFPRHYHGVFRPTAYGLEVFPRLSGMLSAGHALKTHLDANGLSPETMERDAIDLCTAVNASSSIPFCTYATASRW